MNSIDKKSNFFAAIIFLAVLTIFFLNIYSSILAQTLNDTTTLTDEQQIMNTLEILKKSIEQKNTDLFMSCFSKEFNSGGHTYEKVANDVRGAFQVEGVITCAISEVKIAVMGETATVTYVQEIIKENIKTGETIKFSMEIKNLSRKEGDVWKIYSSELISLPKSEKVK